MAFAVIEISTLILAIIIAVVLYVILKNGTQLAMNVVLGFCSAIHHTSTAPLLPFSKILMLDKRPIIELIKSDA